MLFVLFVLIFGFAVGSVEDLALSDNVNLPEQPDAELSPEINPILLEIAATHPEIVAKHKVNVSTTAEDDNKLVDLKELVTSMTQGDAKLTAYIITQLLKLRKKTYAEHVTINARVKRKLKYRDAQIAAKVAQDKLTSDAVAAYAAEVINAKFELLQVDREVKALDRISAKLNSMMNWNDCPSGWRQYGRSCYHKLARSQAWQSQAKCLAVGGSLIRVDNPDDKQAITYYGTQDAWLQLGFFRSLKTGNWAYLDGDEVNPASWYSWWGTYQNNKAYNYVQYYASYKKIRGAHYSWQASPLCEHRLAVNLAERKLNNSVASRAAQTLQKKNVLVKSGFTLGKQWRLSFDVYQKGKISNWGSIVHFTQSGNYPRIPAIWFHPNGQKLHMCMWTQAGTNDCWNSGDIALQKWHSIVMSQTAVNGKYTIKYFIDGTLKASKTQSKPQLLKNVKLYAGDPWYPAFNGYTKNIKMMTF
jgi:hypothetical protein